jgi:signal transduction histidine kinase
MTAPRPQRQSTFLWQGLLILLPVAVLVVVGWLSLRQDKRLAQREAEERAQLIGEELAVKIWSALAGLATNQSWSLSFRVNELSQLISPPAYAPIPTPNPLPLIDLNSRQQQLWRMIQSMEIQRNDSAFISAIEEFIATLPPDNFAAVAHYDWGVWYLRRKQIPEAMAQFELVAEEYPAAIGESGQPLRQLALLKLFENQPLDKGAASPRMRRSGEVRYSRPLMQNVVESTFPPLPSLPLPYFMSLDFLCSNFVCHPTPLTPYFLREIEARWIPQIPPRPFKPGDLDDSYQLFHPPTPEMQEAIRHWQGVWLEHELTRELFAAARAVFSSNAPQPRLFWFQTPQPVKTQLARDASDQSVLEIEEKRWLAFAANADTNDQHYVCLPEGEIGMRVTALMQNVRTLPDYFGIGLELAGAPVSEFAPNLDLWTYRQQIGKSGGAVIRGSQHDAVTQSPLEATEVLASITLPDVGAEALKLKVYLTNPSALFAHQSARRLWFGLLIILSACAALVGLIAARRAFTRQIQLNDMKSNFVSSVSHELRAPIASVRLLAESLERGKISEPTKQNEYFRFIGQECRRLSALIENVLDFSRIEQGRKQYEFEPTNLSTLVEQTVKLMQPYAEERGVKLSAECGVRSAELSVDGRAIQQALVNLIDNAIKHSPKDATVLVALAASEEGSETCNLQPATFNLSVSDNGPGIPASEHEKIFERFYRLGSELRRETPGVGIGLSIVKHVVEAHGGRVRAESEVGQGSRFTIELPLKS